MRSRGVHELVLVIRNANNTNATEARECCVFQKTACIDCRRVESRGDERVSRASLLTAAQLPEAESNEDGRGDDGARDEESKFPAAHRTSTSNVPVSTCFAGFA